MTFLLPHSRQKQLRPEAGRGENSRKENLVAVDITNSLWWVRRQVRWICFGWFDGSRYDDEWRNREVNNGRFAMFAAMGIIVAENETGMVPLMPLLQSAAIAPERPRCRGTDLWSLRAPFFFELFKP